MNDEQFEYQMRMVEHVYNPTVVAALRARDTAQREALARVEAERDGARDALLRVRTQNEMLRDKCSEYVAFIEKLLCQRDTAQAQLAEAVGLLRKKQEYLEAPYPYGAYSYGSDGTARTALAEVKAFLARHAQAEQQEAPQSDPEQSALGRYAVHASGEARLKIESPAAGLQEAQGARVVEFQREDRYIVIKRKDLESTPTLMTHAFLFALDGLSEHLPKRECLVIESDWPEYEPTWAAIQARVEGRDAQAGDELDAVAEAIFNADKGNWYSVGPYPQLHANDKARLRAMARAALATQPAVQEVK